MQAPDSELYEEWLNVSGQMAGSLSSTSML